MNIIIIIADTFRADHLGCYGNDWIKTPHLRQQGCSVHKLLCRRTAHHSCSSRIPHWQKHYADGDKISMPKLFGFSIDN